MIHKRNIAFLCTLMFGIFLFASSASAATLQKPPNNLGLVGYWPMNEGTSTQAGDFSGRGNTGTLTGMANPPTATSGWGNGKLGGGLNFDGSNDYVDIGTNSSLNVVGAGAISVWFKQKGTPGGSYHALVNRFSSNGYQLYIIGGVLSFWNGATVSSTYTLSSSDFTWHHYVVTTNGTTLSFYVDGVAYGTGNMAFGSSVPTVHAIGNFSGNYTNGVMDDVRIYNRALSVAEITNLYKSGSAKLNSSQNSKVTNGLVGLWSFDGADMSGNTAYDRSTSGNNGTLTNGPLRTIGKVGQGMSFDGTDDYVQSNLNKTAIGNTPSISLWIRPNGAQSSRGIMQIADGLTSSVPWILFQRSTPTQVSWYLNEGYVIGQTVNDNTWYHIVLTYDGTTWRAYKNGVADGTYVGPVGSMNGGSTWIGNGWNGYFNGTIDDVRIYNRALTQAEITQLYNMGGSKLNAPQNNIPGSTLQSGLVGLWSFNGPDMSGNTAYDRSTSGNNGTLTNGPVRAIGKVGQGVSLNGGIVNGTQSVNAIASATASIGTVAFWLKRSLNNNVALSPPRLFENRENASSYIIITATGAADATPNAIQAEVNSGTIYVTPSGGISLGTWHHVAVTFVGGEVSQIYLNGVSQSLSTNGGTLIVGNVNQLTIGNRSTSDRGFSGGIDDVRIYNRALTQSEVTQLYLLGK